MKEIVILIFFSFFMLVGLSGCNSVRFSESDYHKIEFNGSLYTDDSGWAPAREKLNEKIAVYLVDYYSKTNYKDVYYAQGFEGDTIIYFCFSTALYIPRRITLFLM